MHREAEFGVASHLIYKAIGAKKDKAQQKTNLLWIRQLIPSLLRMRRVAEPLASHDLPASGEIPAWVADLAHAEEDPNASHEFLEQLKSDFFNHRIFVFTPRGDVIDLPINSSPIDFAYAVHSDIGNHMSGAKVNGKLVALDTHLKNGDIVEIDTKPSSHPTNKWLEHTRTSMARKHIHTALQRQKQQTKE
jgi:(p)ppGpp synthase/HD superfamily hydrolase